ncbi:MAG: hypothetical protein JWM57_2805 [Phycisphaerales bacterium]|nr:hypothetical protein [Phycisphaerales bacterium]
MGIGLAIGCMLAATAHASEPAAPGVAVVELFTSEGCSSCPPADAALAELIRENRGGHVYALAFHVDYWDDLGWPDPFAQAAFTARQGEYRRAFNLQSLYTPQAIINGKAELLGSDRAAIRREVAAVLKTPAVGSLQPTASLDGKTIKVNVAATGLPAETLVRVALVQSGLSVDVRRGENGGKTLTHDGVVRVFTSATLSKDLKATATLTAPSGGWPKNSSIVVFAQQPGDLHVLAATEIALPR